MSGLGAGRRLPGDDVLPGADVVLDRMLDLAGTPEQVWPWLEQLGKDRAGWYLPHVVEMVVPRSRRAARGIGSRWQGLQVGDAIPDWGPGSPSFEVLEIERPKHLVYWSERARSARRGVARPPLRLTWALVLEPRRGASRLHLRLRLDLGHPAGPLATYGGGLVDWLTVQLLGGGLNERLRRLE
ncbi:MAG: hypothetical protein H0U61_03190 [Nocardioidaceae bacterium]|nr:hypothetical protein [Nocardioidaceae bacterium]